MIIRQNPPVTDACKHTSPYPTALRIDPRSPYPPRPIVKRSFDPCRTYISIPIHPLNLHSTQLHLPVITYLPTYPFHPATRRAKTDRFPTSTSTSRGLPACPWGCPPPTSVYLPNLHSLPILPISLSILPIYRPSTTVQLHYPQGRAFFKAPVSPNKVSPPTSGKHIWQQGVDIHIDCIDRLLPSTLLAIDLYTLAHPS